MKILTVIGARPQFIKAAPVSKEIAKRSGVEEVIVHTGQHFDKAMSDIFFNEMGIPAPNYNLNINSVGHGAMTGRMMEEIEKIIGYENPDWVMVYGDTNSTLAGALTAKKMGVKVLHVESGLRSFNMDMPEEINRILTDRISDVLACPTEGAISNLVAEGFEQFPCIFVNTGDVMQDAALLYGEVSAKYSTVLDVNGLIGEEFVLCTIHRAENTNNIDRLRSIVAALNIINEEKRVILPIHPRTQAIALDNRIKFNFDPIGPVGYFDMIELLKSAQMVLTDSGGLQKEAFFFNKPCVTMRDETEWTELIESGGNVLAGTDIKNILAAFEYMKDSSVDFDADLYGDGQASKKIINSLFF